MVSRPAADIPGTCSGAAMRRQEEAGGNGHRAARLNHPGQGPPGSLSVPPCKKTPELCKLPPFTQSFGHSPGSGANQGSHHQNSAKTLTLKKNNLQAAEGAAAGSAATICFIANLRAGVSGQW